MIVTAIDEKNASKINGIMPNAVVSAAIETGRRRLADASMIAVIKLKK